MAELDIRPRQEDSHSEGGSGTVAKALRVLEAIAEAPAPLRFGDLLKSQPYPKATLHRLIKTLIQNGMVAYDARRQTYHLGLRLIRLARSAWTRSTLAEAARPTLDGLSADAIAVDLGGLLRMSAQNVAFDFAAFELDNNGVMVGGPFLTLGQLAVEVGQVDDAVRAMKLASEPIATPTGFTGFSIEPSGLDRVRMPGGVVGEYCPLVRP